MELIDAFILYQIITSPQVWGSSKLRYFTERNFRVIYCIWGINQSFVADSSLIVAESRGFVADSSLIVAEQKSQTLKIKPPSLHCIQNAAFFETTAVALQHPNHALQSVSDACAVLG